MKRTRMMGFWSGRLFVGTRVDGNGIFGIEFLITDRDGSMRDTIPLGEWMDLVEFIGEQVIEHNREEDDDE